MAIAKGINKHTVVANNSSTITSDVINGYIGLVDIPNSYIVQLSASLDPVTDYLAPDAPNGGIGVVRNHHGIPWMLCVLDGKLRWVNAQPKPSTTHVSGIVHNATIHSVAPVVDDDLVPYPAVGSTRHGLKETDVVLAPGDVSAEVVSVEVRFVDIEVTDEIRDQSITTSYADTRKFTKMVKVTTATPIDHTAYILTPNGLGTGFLSKNIGTIVNNIFYIAIP